MKCRTSRRCPCVESFAFSLLSELVAFIKGTSSFRRISGAAFSRSLFANSPVENNACAQFHVGIVRETWFIDPRENLVATLDITPIR